jgi:hypothetical protein
MAKKKKKSSEEQKASLYQKPEREFKMYLTGKTYDLFQEALKKEFNDFLIKAETGEEDKSKEKKTYIGRRLGSDVTLDECLPISDEVIAMLLRESVTDGLNLKFIDGVYYENTDEVPEAINAKL